MKSFKQVSKLIRLLLLVTLAPLAPALLTFFHPSKALGAVHHRQGFVLAQTSSPESTSPASDTATQDLTLRLIDTTLSAPFGPNLQQSFEQQFPQRRVQIERQASGLEAVLNGTTDLAAISRGLTAAEKAQGLVQVTIAREKVAIVVAAANPFQESLSIDQLVKIFQGEIQDWSEVGGPPGQIRLIDRPSTSLIRQALQTYLVFRTQRFEPGQTVTQLPEDETDLLAKELGADGIGYAPASQVLQQDQLRPVAMYGTLPEDDRYPFSQPFVLVYRDKPTPQVQAFIEFATSAAGQAAIAQAKTQTAQPKLPPVVETQRPQETPVDSPVPESESTPSPEGQTSDQPGWLPIGLVGLVLVGVIGAVLKSLGVGRKPPPPQPAPNYSEKIFPRRSELAEEAELEAKATFAETASPTVGANAVAAAHQTTQLQDPGTQLQAPDTQIQDPDTQLPSSDKSQELRDPDTQLPSPDTQLQDPGTQLQAPQADANTQLQSPDTQLQDPGTQLQAPQADANTQLQSPDTQLQDPGTQLQAPQADANTQLPSPNTQLQDLPDSNTQPSELPDSDTQFQNPDTQLQDPKTQLQDPPP